MFHDKDSQLIVNLDYQLDKKKLAVMIIKTLFKRCYSMNSELRLDFLQRHVMHYIIDLTNNSLSKSKYKWQTKIVPHI